MATGIGRNRQFRGAAASLVTGYGAFVSIYHLLYIANVFTRLNIFILPYSHLGVSLSLVCSLVFLLVPATKSAPRDRLPWYDALLAAIALAPGVYMLFFWKLIDRHLEMATVPLYEAFIFWWALIMMFESARRTIGLAMPIVAAFFFIYLFTAPFFPGFVYGSSFSANRVMSYMFQSSYGVWGEAMSAAGVLVFVFILFGQFIVVTGAGNYITKFAFGLLGHVRGGPAKAGVVASGLFGTISGGSVVNVVTVGAFTIPMMKSIGYEPEFAAAVEAVSSNGGQIMPPVMGVVAFLIAEFLAMPYIQVAIASVLPAVLYYLAEFIMVDLEAVRLGLKGLPRSQLPPVIPIIRESWPYVIPPVALLLFLSFFSFTAALACLYALIVLLIVNLLRRRERMTLRTFIRGLSDGAQGMMIITPACALAGIIVGSIGLSAVGVKLSSQLIDISMGNAWLLLVLTAAASFVLGMGMTSVPCYLILIVLVAPALIKLGVLPIAAHLFVFYWGIVSFITPPVALAAWAAAAIAQANPWKTGWKAVRLGIVVYIIPFMFVMNPAFLMQGDLAGIARAVATGLAGTTVLAAAVAGYAVKRISWFERVVCVVASIMLMYPSWQANIAGVVIVLPSFLWQLRLFLLSRGKGHEVQGLPGT